MLDLFDWMDLNIPIIEFLIKATLMPKNVLQKIA
jgi:hypothetical protein